MLLEPAAKVAATESLLQKITLSIGADMSAPVSVDGHFIGWSPVSTRVDSGSHTIVIGKGERQQTMRTMVTAGRTNKVFVSLRQPNNEHLTTDVR